MSVKCGACGLVQFPSADLRCLRCREATLAGERPAMGRSRAPADPPSEMSAADAAARLRRRISVLAAAAAFVVAEVGGGAVYYRAVRNLVVAPVAAQASTLDHTTRDGVVTLRAPRAFVDATGRVASERDAELVLAEPRHGARVYVESIEKRALGRVVTLTMVANAWRAGVRSLRHVELGRSTDTRFAGRPAVEFVFDADDESGRRIRGIMLIVDGDGFYHFLVAFCGTPRYPVEEPRLRAILASARMRL